MIIMGSEPKPRIRDRERNGAGTANSLDASRRRALDSAHYNLVRILSRVAEGRARRRHSNRSTIAWMLVLTPAQRLRIETMGVADGIDKMVFGRRRPAVFRRPSLSITSIL